MPLTRRDFLLRGGMLVAAGAFGGPALALAQAPTEQRLFVVVLRGALDGLAAVVPYGDRSYGDARGPLALPDHVLIRLDSFYAMNSALASLAVRYQQKRLLVLHATATPYRSRSHFDGQDVLDSGAVEAHASSTGWLNRALVALRGGQGVAIGPSVPLLLQGPGDVTSWSPSILPGATPDLLAQVVHLYEADPLLSRAIRDAEMLRSERPESVSAATPRGGARGPQAFAAMMRRAGELLGDGRSGLRLGAIELGGWDTHVAQGLDRGRLANAMQQLSSGLEAFEQALGPAWQQTAVLVVTEFGRTVKGNGTGGSDHGTGTVAFLMGGKVAGGRVIGDWPGLAPHQLYQERDLRPVNDLRALQKGVLAEHLGLDEGALGDAIFPGSTDVPALRGLVQA